MVLGGYLVEGDDRLIVVFPLPGEQCEGSTLPHLPTLALDPRTRALLHLMLVAGCLRIGHDDSTL